MFVENTCLKTPEWHLMQDVHTIKRVGGNLVDWKKFSHFYPRVYAHWVK